MIDMQKQYREASIACSITKCVVIAVMLVLQSPQQTWAQDVQAFVTEVSGQVQVARADGEVEHAAVGGQLFDGDTVDVGEGTAVLIYLSGRSVEVAADSRHTVEGGTAQSSQLMGRVMNTIAEIAGPQSDADQPVVHGMARDLAELSGALPANTRIWNPDFSFSWDALEGVEEYEITLEDTAGNVQAIIAVKGTSMQARKLPMQSGKRFVWLVQETGSFLPRSSGRSWFEIAGEEESDRIGKALAEIDTVAVGDTKSTLKAISLYNDGLYYESERLLKETESKRALSPLEGKLIKLAYIKMERWDRLPEPPTEEGSPESSTTDQ